jgi:hypothetical protein
MIDAAFVALVSRFPLRVAVINLGLQMKMR